MYGRYNDVDYLTKKVVATDTRIEAGFIDSKTLKELEESIVKIKDIETLWILDLKQKSMCKWLIEGDENSTFFHGIINDNLKGSHISGLKINGMWVTNLDIIKKQIV